MLLDYASRILCFRLLRGINDERLYPTHRVSGSQRLVGLQTFRSA
jgi:hypothetical protein